MHRRSYLGLLTIGSISGCIQFTKENNTNSANSGESRWGFEANAPLTSPVADADNVYVGTIDHNIYSIERDSGETVWSVGAEQFSSTELIMDNPRLVNGSLYIKTNKDILKINKDSGEIEDSLTDYVTADFMTVNSDMVVGYDSGEGITAYDSVAGSQIWQSNAQALGKTFSPVIGDEIILYGTVFDYVDSPIAERNKDTRVFALDKHTGEELWHFTPNEFIGRSAGISYIISDNKVVVVDDNGKIFCLAGSNGDVLWTQTVDLQASGNIAPRALNIGGNLSIASGDVYSISFQSGDIIWQTSLEATLFVGQQKPPIDGAKAWIPTGDYFEPKGITSIQDGNAVNSHTFSKAFKRMPAISGENIYISHVDDTLRAYDSLEQL